ncbi:MAG: MATE family efflux transporter [Oscillospiraceae bacterium]|nr:MATE family efflux transporter [Oscillospiraceae bacterium]
MELPRRQLFTNKALVWLFIPLFLEQLLNTLVGMVDGIMVSSVDEAAIAAVSLVGNISAVILNLFAALATGGAIVTSQLIGAGDMNKARRSAGQVITMTVAVSSLLGLLCCLFNRQLLSLVFGKVEADVMDNAVTYFFYNALSFPFLAVCSAGGAIMRAQGNSRVAFYVSLLRNAVNLGGNAICIFGLGMGVEGVAIPTALCRVVGAIAIMLVVMNKKQKLRPAASDIFHIAPRLMSRVLRIGLPTAFENSLFQLGRIMTLSMITGFGTYQITANSTANTLCSLVVCITTACRMTSMTVIGQCVGAKDLWQIKENSRKLLVAEYVCNALAAVAVILLRYPLLGLYSKLSEETIELAAELICICLGASIFIYPLSFFLTGPLRAANDSAFPMWVSIISMAIFRLTLAQILCVNLGWGARGVWWAMPADWVCRAICFSWRWFGGSWKKKCGLSEDQRTAKPSKHN